MLSEPVIRVDNVSKCYPIYDKPQHRLWQMLYGKRKQFFKEFWALRELSFAIYPGESIGIIGKNGSGKSTLLQLICGTLTATSGQIQTHGRIAALLELGAGFNSEFTGRENVFMCASLYGLTRAQIEARYEDIIAFADIGDYVDQPVKTYSSGMYVRLAFAVIAHIDASILIIDEALAVGDAFFQQKCMRFLRNFREKGTLIFVSHDSGAVMNLCNRALLLSQGQLRMDSSPKAVTDAYLASVYEEQQGKSCEEFVDPAVLISANSGTVEQTIHADSLVASFGTGDGMIIETWLENAQGHRVQQVAGDDAVVLQVKVMAKKEIAQPIIGFQVKDRLGQVIFSGNTYLTYIDKHCVIEEGAIGLTKFCFSMPCLRPGSYSLGVAFANGTQENHTQLHWIHDAFIFEIYPTEGRNQLADGLIGIPIQNIELMLL